MTRPPVQVLVLAKEPVPGRVKTRLCPPCTPAQAARIAAAALADTLDAVQATPAAGRTLVLDGHYPVPPGWRLVPQRGGGLGHRLAHAFADTALPGRASVLVGMDTPQLTADLLGAIVLGLATADAVLGPATDGGWWALGLREPRDARVLADVVMSTSDTGADTIAALRGIGATVALGPVVRDVDHAEDARAVAALCPGGRFAAAVADHLGRPGTDATDLVGRGLR
jgi:rSAM/selenodomain-associated transferase 1